MTLIVLILFVAWAIVFWVTFFIVQNTIDELEMSLKVKQIEIDILKAKNKKLRSRGLYSLKKSKKIKKSTCCKS